MTDHEESRTHVPQKSTQTNIPAGLEPLLTVAEVAEILGVSTAWATPNAAGRRKPRLPAIGLGQPKGPKLWRFRRADLERFLDEYKT